jgi:Bacterial PH domain
VRGVETIRHRTNTVLAWLLAYGLLALIVAVDPLGLYATWKGGGQGSAAMFLATLWFLIFSVVGFALFARPRVELRRDALVLRNACRDIEIPWSQIDEVDATRGIYLRVVAAGRSYSAMGIEKSNLALLSGSSDFVGAVSERIGTHRKGAPISPGDSVRIRWRKIEKTELALLGGWVIYIGGSLLRSH